MDNNITKIALIPSFEPDYNLIKITEELKNHNYIVIVVNDGSEDKYMDIFNQCKCKLISYKQNRGKGYALKKGLKYIKKNYNAAYIVTMDSDGQHKVRDADRLIKYLLKNEGTLVLGSRKRGKKTPIKSFLGNMITCLVFSLVTTNKIYDTQTGMRAFRSNLIDYMLEIEGDRFEYEMNVLLNLKDSKIKVHEITIETVYFDSNSNTHFNPIKDSFRIYKEIIKFSLSSIISFVIDYVLYILFNLLTNNIAISNILARIISATTNYNINKNIVFKSKKEPTKTLCKYIILASTILILNTLIVTILSNIINIYLAKIITEIILFIISWLIQRTLIFKGDDNNKKI